MTCTQTMTMKQVSCCDSLLCAVVTHSSQTCSPPPFEENEPILSLVLLCEDAGQITKSKRARKEVAEMRICDVCSTWEGLGGFHS